MPQIVYEFITEGGAPWPIVAAIKDPATNKRLVEIGADQKSAVERLFREAGAQGVMTIQDLSGHDRVVTGFKKALGI